MGNIFEIIIKTLKEEQALAYREEEERKKERKKRKITSSDLFWVTVIIQLSLLQDCR